MPPAAAWAVHSEGEAADVEALSQSLRLARARVRRLEAAVEAEEAALVQVSLTEAEVDAAAGPAAALAARQAEAKLQSRVGQTRQLLDKEKAQLRAALSEQAPGGGGRQLALAVGQGVDDYFADVRQVRTERRAVQGAAANLAQPGSHLHRLREEERRLDDAVRSLRAEIDAMAVDEEAAAGSRRELAEALRRREHGLGSVAGLADMTTALAAAAAAR